MKVSTARGEVMSFPLSIALKKQLSPPWPIEFDNFRRIYMHVPILQRPGYNSLAKKENVFQVKTKRNREGKEMVTIYIETAKTKVDGVVAHDKIISTNFHPCIVTYANRVVPRHQANLEKNLRGFFFGEPGTGRPYRKLQVSATRQHSPK